MLSKQDGKSGYHFERSAPKQEGRHRTQKCVDKVERWSQKSFKTHRAYYRQTDLVERCRALCSGAGFTSDQCLGY